MQRKSIVKDVQGKNFKTCVDENFYILHKKPEANPNPKLSPRVTGGLTPGKTISVENLKANAKGEYRQRLLRKNL